jgi:hypothetical protein
MLIIVLVPRDAIGVNDFEVHCQLEVVPKDSRILQVLGVRCENSDHTLG